MRMSARYGTNWRQRNKPKSRVWLPPFHYETVVHLTGKGLGGRNQELALAAAPALAGLKHCCVFSVGSDGTDGPTDAAGGYVDGETEAALRAAGRDVYRTLADNDAYHALQAVGGLIRTGATGTNVNDVAVALVE